MPAQDSTNNVRISSPDNVLAGAGVRILWHKNNNIISSDNGIQMLSFIPFHLFQDLIYCG